jgi:hypothetical protein
MNRITLKAPLISMFAECLSMQQGCLAYINIQIYFWQAGNLDMHVSSNGVCIGGDRCIKGEDRAAIEKRKAGPARALNYIMLTASILDSADTAPSC